MPSDGDRVCDWIERIHCALQERQSGGKMSLRQMKVIAYLRARDGRATAIGDLQAFLGISHPTASGIIREMEEQGLLRVRVDERDRRVRLLTLGDAVGEALSGLPERDEEELLLRGFDERERGQLRALLARAYANLR